MHRTHTPWAATAVGLVTALTLTACGSSGDDGGKSAAGSEKQEPNISVQEGKAADSTRPGSAPRRLWMPFPCGQKWRVDSYDSGHAPALDMVREPQRKTEGSTVRAAASGKVKFRKWDDGAGNVVQIKHHYGYYTTYLHLKKIHVKDGQKVGRTTKIGQVGKTGANAHGTPHLHFEVAKGAKAAAHWGEEGSKYRKTANLYPKSYKGAGKTWRNQVSHSCSAPKPTKWGKYKVVKPVNMRTWAGVKYKSQGKLKRGQKITLGCNNYRKPDGKLFRRLKGGDPGTDYRGTWVRASSKYLDAKPGC